MSEQVCGIIYDVGMHNGDDSRYYLDKGFKVVGIDANPHFCELCRDRFQPEIEQGRMIVLNTGVGPQAGSLDFHVNLRETQISTFARQGFEDDPWETIRVPVRLLSSIVLEHGAAHYIKIDIEHFDHLVLDELLAAGIRPPYLSAEAHSFAAIEGLMQLGYEDFKIVEGAKVPEMYASHPITTTGGELVQYQFQPFSSGPFGDDISGPWLSKVEMLKRMDAIGLGWVDVHARAVA